MESQHENLIHHTHIEDILTCEILSLLHFYTFYPIKTVTFCPFTFPHTSIPSRYCDKVYLWLAVGRWLSLVSSTNKTDPLEISEILLKSALNIIYNLPLSAQLGPHHNEKNNLLTFYSTKDIKQRLVNACLPSGIFNVFVNKIFG